MRKTLLLTALSAALLSACGQTVEAPKSEPVEQSTVKAEAPVIVESKTPIVLPGAPGQAGKTLSATEASKIADNSYTKDDVAFMQNMIPHHAQATEMAALVKDRTNTEDILKVAERIDASQADEIKFMEDWLKDRGESLLDETSYGSDHSGHEGMEMGGDKREHKGHHQMEGMATPEQMAELATLEGTDFDAMFLRLMITHHEGAITMVDNLTSQQGSAYDPVLFDFINDVEADQKSEIERMSGILTSLSSDSRVGLKAGFKDAEEAAWNMKLEVALDKPAGFFDPNSPAGLPPIIEKKKKDGEADEDKKKDAKKDAEKDGEEKKKEKINWGKRYPLLSFSNTDMAFSGDVMVAGSYHGFNVYKLKENGLPELHSSVVCPGGQGDVSIVGNLLIMSVEQTRGRVDCGREGIAEDISTERFRGIRIFDISDLAAPIQVGQVQTCRGSHTHSVVSSDKNRIVVYNSGTSSVRKEEELAGCIGRIPGDQRTALFRIDVIEIPVADPSKARIVDSPTVFADEEKGTIAGLWTGGDHGKGTQSSRQTNQCHDITIFPAAKIAAGACSGNGIIFDISNPLKPKRIDAVVDKGFAYWHSATFNNDGTKVVFTDEWGGGGRPRCRVHDPKDWGANAIYDIVDGKLNFQSYYKMPAPQTDSENCVAHNGSVVPVPGRDIFVQAWYQGGVSIMDFTDSANPKEIAFFDRGPVHESKLTTGGYWSTYFYNGKIYGTEIARGLDVFSLQPSEHLSASEIAAAAEANMGEIFNPQQQFPVTWKASPTVAQAYADQMARAGALTDEMASELSNALSNPNADSLAALSNKVKSLSVKSRSKDGLVTTLAQLAKSAQ